MKKTWKVIRKKNIIKHKLFSVDVHEVELPNKHVIKDYFLIKPNPGSIIVAITEDDNIIFVTDYKYAVNEYVLTLPGGLAESKKEMSKDVAIRELAEETGYRAKKMVCLGNILPLPSNIQQKTTVFVALKCKKTQEQSLDASEDIRIKTIKRNKIAALVKKNIIQDSLTLAALYLASSYIYES